MNVKNHDTTEKNVQSSRKISLEKKGSRKTPSKLIKYSWLPRMTLNLMPQNQTPNWNKQMSHSRLPHLEVHPEKNLTMKRYFLISPL